MALAQILLANPSAEISDSVVNFFEDLGLFLDNGYLDEKMVWEMFGYYAVRWWEATKNQAIKQRRTHNDQTLFGDFETLAEKMRKRDAKAGLQSQIAEDIKAFLKDESRP
jgi:hypothetical protein